MVRHGGRLYFAAVDLQILWRPVEKFFYTVGAVFLLTVRSLASFLSLRLDLGVLMEQLAIMGLSSLPIVALINIFTGAIMALQLTRQAVTYGATQFVGMAVAVVMARELGPVLTGVVMAGRVGSAMSSEIGTMVVTEQVDALRALSISPTHYLVAPRMVACMSMVPVLSMICGVMAVYAGFVVAGALADIHGKIYFGSIQESLRPYDVTVGLFKSACFGVTVAAVGCFKGLDTTGGARGVGQATTGSVVLSILLIFLENFIMTAVFF